MKKIQDKGVEGAGKILSYETGNRGYKTPIIEFTPRIGEMVTAKPFLYASTDLSKIRLYNGLINTEVVVRYDPDDPKKFVLTGEKSFNYIAFSIFIGMGLFFYRPEYLQLLRLCKIRPAILCISFCFG